MQCAPPLSWHDGNLSTRIMGGPVQGHFTGGGGPMHISPISHAPEASPVSGSMHGAQRSLSAQMSRGRSSPKRAILGTHRLMHRPSDPPSDLHAGGGAPPVLISWSGTQ